MLKSYTYGTECENLVCEYLNNQGYTVLNTRYKTPYGEIDIIAHHLQTLIFIEVKARKKLYNQEILTPKQMKRISEAANLYISLNYTLEQDSRFDFILLEGYKIVSHIKNAWSFN